MRSRILRFTGIVAVALAGMVVGRVTKGAEPGPAEKAVQLAQEMAAAASRRDVKSLAQLIPQTDKVAYVSNGRPISGRKYAETLGAYYDTLKVLDFKWERWEVIPLSERAATFTGWANVRTVDQKGGTEAARALFTMVFADDGSGWKRVLAQKWQTEVPAVIAAHPAAPEERVPAASRIAVTFNGPVNVTRDTFHLECPAGTPIAVTATPEPGADDDAFLLRPERALPAGANCKLKVVAGQVSDPRFGQTMAADSTLSFKVAPGS